MIFIRIAILLFSLGICNIANSQTNSQLELRIVTADRSEPTERIVKQLLIKFPKAAVISSGRMQKKANVIYIAVGPSALRSLIDQDIDGAIASIFTSRKSYELIMEAGSPSKNYSRVITAIYADPSPIIQMQLIALLFQKRVSVAVLAMEKTRTSFPLLRHAALENNLKLKITEVSSDSDIKEELNLITGEDVLLAMPDNEIYNENNIRTILMSTYRKNIAIVGFSVALVKAGALGTTYSNIDDIVAQTEEILIDFSSSGKLPRPQYPKYFSTAINDAVAHSLNIQIGDNVRKFAQRYTASK